MFFVSRFCYLLIGIFFIYETNICCSQTILAHSGLVTIPTAEILEDRDVVFSVGYLPPTYSVLRPPDFGDFFYFISLGYLPFLETNFGLVRSEHIGKEWGIGDRVAKFRFQILKESQKFPSLVLGLHDPFGLIGEEWAQHFCASYLVASKNRKVYQNYILGFHLGYGTDWIKAADYQFVGLFGGVSFQPEKFGKYIIEYDSKNINFGFEITIKKKIKASIAAINLDSFAGQISYKIKL